MTRHTIACVAVLIAAPLFAADAPDKGRQLLPRLFESAAADAADATARVQVDNKDVILGTIMSKDGYILTKGSELIGKQGKLKGPVSCLLRDGLAFDAEVKGYDSKSDLMLLKVDALALTPIKLAPSKLAEPGNWVAGVGLKDNRRTGDPDTIEPVAVGVISSASRPLYGAESRVENANRGFLGILFELSNDPKNTRVQEVKNEFAKKAGMKAGDAIVELDGVKVVTREDVFNVLNDTYPGEVLSVKVKRKAKDGDEELTFKIKTIPPTLMDRGALQNSMGGTLSDRRGGFTKVIQHDTVLDPAQCGGPLVDLDGHVLGLNIARAGRVETWALPTEEIEKVYADLKAGKYPYPPKDDSEKTKK